MGLKKYLTFFPFLYFIQTRVVLSLNFFFQYIFEIVTSLVIFYIFTTTTLH